MRERKKQKQKANYWEPCIWPWLSPAKHMLIYWRQSVIKETRFHIWSHQRIIYNHRQYNCSLWGTSFGGCRIFRQWKTVIKKKCLKLLQVNFEGWRTRQKSEVTLEGKGTANVYRKVILRLEIGLHCSFSQSFVLRVSCGAGGRAWGVHHPPAELTHQAVHLLCPALGQALWQVKQSPRKSWRLWESHHENAQPQKLLTYVLASTPDSLKAFWSPWNMQHKYFCASEFAWKIIFPSCIFALKSLLRTTTNWGVEISI